MKITKKAEKQLMAKILPLLDAAAIRDTGDMEATGITVFGYPLQVNHRRNLKKVIADAVSLADLEQRIADYIDKYPRKMNPVMQRIMEHKMNLQNANNDSTEIAETIEYVGSPDAEACDTDGTCTTAAAGDRGSSERAVYPDKYSNGFEVSV